MSENNSIILRTAGGSSIGVPTILSILFIAFKLAGIITWKWIWVLSPFWICIGIYLAIISLSLFAVLFFAAISLFKDDDW